MSEYKTDTESYQMPEEKKPLMPGVSNTSILHKMTATVNPFAPLAFDISTGFQAAARIAIFAGASYFLWSKSKKAAYVTAGAAAVSLFTSLSAKHGV